MVSCRFLLAFRSIPSGEFALGRGGNAFLMGFWGLSGGTGCWVCEGGEFFCVRFLERRGKSKIDLFFLLFSFFVDGHVFHVLVGRGCRDWEECGA